MPRCSPFACWRLFPRLAVLVLLSLGGLWAQSVSVTPSHLTFVAAVGASNPPSLNVQVTSDQPGRSFKAQKDPFVSAAWLTVFPSTGVTPATLTFSVDASRFFAAGSQTVNVTVSLPDFPGVFANVEVTAIVSGSGAGPLINLAPSSLSFSAGSGAGSLPPKTLDVLNAGGGFLNYQIAVSYPPGEATGWLSVTPPTGTAQGGTGAQPVTHTIGVNATGLGQGQHSASLTITGNAANSPRVVPVTLSVAAAPSLLIDPGTLSFSASQGGANPAPQSIAISSAQGGTIAYEIASDQTWLEVEPASGSTASGSQVHSVSVDIATLPQGTYSGNLTVTPQNGSPPINVAVTLSIARPSAIVTVPGRLDFLGNSRIPINDKRVLSIVSNPLASGRWTARVLPASVTWLKVSPAEGGIPGNLLVEVDAQGLGAATLEAQIEIKQVAVAALSAKSVGGVAQGIGTALIPVTLTLINQEPLLAATPALLEFSTIEGSVTSQRQILHVENRGGPQLIWESEVSTEDGEPWLVFGPTSGEAPTRVTVFANPTGLDAGLHQGRIRLKAGSQRQDVPVSLLIQPAQGVLAVDQTSLYFEVQQGVAGTLTKTMRVLNRGTGSLSWSAQVRAQSGTQQWLTVAPASGVSEAGSADPTQLTFIVRPESLDPGVQTGLVEISSTSSGSRFVTVALNVVPAGGTPASSIEPSGLSFSASPAGVTPAAQTVNVRSNRSSAVGFLAAASTFNGANWLQVQPANGNAAPAGSDLTVSANHAGLAPGFYRGLVSVTFNDGAVRSAPVVLTVRPPGNGCVAASATLLPVSPVQNFIASVGRAVRLETAAVDDCGAGVPAVAMLAVFNNGDPAVPLRDLGGGRYGATWAPRNAGSQVNVRYEMLSGPSVVNSTLVGSIASTAAPRLAQNGSVNGASFESGGPLAPGGIMSTFGFNLASGNAVADTVPLPTRLGGVQLLVGGIEAPLFFAGFGQVNAQVPYELEVNRRTEVIASVNGQYTVPAEITLATARPGIFLMPAASGPDRAIAQNQDFGLNSAANPAARGEVVILYLTGSGEVDPAVATGVGAPAEEPLARVALPATATIGGKPAEIQFLGLTPGFVGLTQANLVVPADAPIGPDVPVIITIDGQPSNSLVIAVKQGG